MILKFFLNETPASLAEYRALQAKQTLAARILAVVGLATLVLGYFGTPLLLPQGGSRADFLQGFYSGAGCGIVVAAAVWRCRLKKLLGDEAALKRAFVRDTDERSQAVNRRAMVMAGLVLVICLYAAVLVAGLVYPPLFWFCVAGNALYFVLFLAFHAYYNRRM